MPLEAFFPYRLAVAAETFSRNLIDVYGRAYGLSREEWRLLYLLAEAERLTSLDLSRRTTLDKVQVSRAAQRLEEKGLITHATSDEDRRLRVYECTDAGRGQFEEVMPRVQARAAEILGAMTEEERAALDKGLAALTRAAAERAGTAKDDARREP